MSKRKRVGLVLSTGFMGGYYLFGMLKVLTQEKLPVDAIAGSSIGALVAAAFATGTPIERIIEIAKTWPPITITTPNYQTDSGILDTHPAIALWQKYFGNPTFADLAIPLAVAMVHYKSGKLRIVREGPVVPAIRAAIAHPLAFGPVLYDADLYMDAGVVDPLPIFAVREMGVDFVVCLEVERVSPPVERPHPLGRLARFAIHATPGRYRPLASALVRIPKIKDLALYSVKTLQAQLIEACIREGKPDLLISVFETLGKVPGLPVSPKVMAKGPHFIDLGEKVAQAYVPQIRDLRHAVVKSYRASFTL